MIERLRATYGGVAQYARDAVPEPRVIPIHEVFHHTELARSLDGPGGGIEMAPFGWEEPTF